MKKHILIAVTAMMAAATMSAQTIDETGYNTRIDYFDRNGKKILSTYPGTSNAEFSITRDGDFWNAGNLFMEGSKIGYFNFVQYKSEPYPINVEVSDEVKESDIEVTYEIISGDDSSRVRGVTATQDNKAMPGTRFRFYVIVPEGSYPTVDFEQDYTHQNSGLQSTFPIENYPLENFKWRSIQNPDVLAKVKKYLDHYEFTYFKKVEGKPGHWTYETSMPNEPLTLTFGYMKPTAEGLRNLVARAIRSLYYVDLENYYFNAVFPNGEPYIMQAVGEVFGNDYVSDFITTMGDCVSHISSPNTYFTVIPWQSCMSEIIIANYVLNYMKLYKGYVSEAEMNNARAQMLTLRSNAYWRLLQIYGARWQDSNNGEAYCAPLILEFSGEQRPLAKMKDIIAQCYKDLDEAIRLFSATEVERYNILTPTVNVARAIKMRIALLSEDWITAKDMAEMIVNENQLSSTSEMLSGFFAPTSSWLWGAPNDDRNLDYNTGNFSWETQTACNGTLAAFWGFAPGAIDRDLFEKIRETDIRKKMFVSPSIFKTDQKMSWEKLYSSLNDDITFRRFSSSNYNLIINAITTPKGVEDRAYYNSGIAPGIEVPMRMCGQFKFYQSTSQAYENNDVVVLLRTEEALLTLAEARYMLGDESGALAAVNMLVSARHQLPLVLDSRGIYLYREIQLQRKIELWGEGFSWFDSKRWMEPIDRRAGAPGNPDSGNWPKVLAYKMGTDAYNGWRYVIPKYALEANPMIDISLMNYKDGEYATSTKIGKAKAPASDKSKFMNVKGLKMVSPTLEMKPSADLFVK